MADVQEIERTNVDLTKPRHRAPSPSGTALRILTRMVEALGLAVIGWSITLAGWLGVGAPGIARSIACGVGIMLTAPIPMVLFWVRIRRVLR